LRTIFPRVEGRPRQVVLEDANPRVTRIVLSGTNASIARIRENAKELCRHEASSGFDLERGPLMRALIIEISDNESVLMLNMHHIISDGWSVGIFVREFDTILEAFAKREEYELQELTLQYADYAYWERITLEGTNFAEDRTLYWRNQLLGVPESIDLPFDFSRTKNGRNRGRSRALMLDQQKAEKLRTFCRKRNVSVSAALLSIFKILLCHYTKQDDLCLGFVTANRSVEVSGLLGAFFNVLPLRTRFSQEESFEEVLSSVNEALSDAIGNEISIEKLRRDNSLKAKLNVTFNYLPDIKGDDFGSNFKRFECVLCNHFIIF